MTALKPGQLCTINNVVYRAVMRTHGCTGCALSDITRCPNVGKRRIECWRYNVILKNI